MASTAEEIVRACKEAVARGADFPTIWHALLKDHPFVAGVPIQRLDGTVALLEIPLITGQRIVCGPGSADYAVATGRGSTAVM